MNRYIESLLKIEKNNSSNKSLENFVINKKDHNQDSFSLIIPWFL